MISLHFDILRCSWTNQYHVPLVSTQRPGCVTSQSIFPTLLLSIHPRLAAIHMFPFPSVWRSVSGWSDWSIMEDFPPFLAQGHLPESSSSQIDMSRRQTNSPKRQDCPSPLLSIVDNLSGSSRDVRCHTCTKAESKGWKFILLKTGLAWWIYILKTMMNGYLITSTYHTPKGANFDVAISELSL